MKQRRQKRMNAAGTEAKQSWLKWPRNRREWVYRILTVAIPLAGLLAAILAIPQVSDHFKSPQEKLASLGYDYTETKFWAAIQNKHMEAVEHFHEAGMELDASRMSQLFEDDVFSKPLAEYLIGSSMLSVRHCPTTVDRLSVYTKHSSHADKAKLIQGLCGVAEVQNALISKRKELEAQQEKAINANTDLAQRRKACIARYLGEDEEAFVTQSATASLTGAGTLTERECVLAQVHIKLVVPSLGEPDIGAWIKDGATHCCGIYVHQQREDNPGIKSIEGALAALGTLPLDAPP